MRTSAWIVAACLSFWPSAGWGQGFTDLRREFDAGKYQEVADRAAASGDRSPQMLYLLAHAYQKLDRDDQARGAFGQLASLPEDNAWAFVGRAAIAVMDRNYDAALDASRRAVSLNEGLAEAHYQLGLVEAFRQSFGDAAAALDKAAELDPQFAYAHYQAGLAHYRNKRTDRMSSHFEMFLKLAPNAPERPEVESILRTLRGR
jgi:tetratricopeptide (TPR) repeat protein